MRCIVQIVMLELSSHPDCKDENEFRIHNGAGDGSLPVSTAHQLVTAAGGNYNARTNQATLVVNPARQ